MDESNAVRATTPAATCELQLSLWHVPSSADLRPLDFSTAASRETPAWCDLRLNRLLSNCRCVHNTPDQ